MGLNDDKTYGSDLLGDYQKANIKTAVAAIQQLKGFTVSEKNICEGLLNVVKNTNLKGRWQVLQENPKVICDTAHNKEGLRIVLNQLHKEAYRKLHIILGVVSDKDLATIVEFLPNEARYYFCEPDIPRAMPVLELEVKMKAYRFEGHSYSSVEEALFEAKLEAKPNDVIYIGGSTFVVAEVV